MNELECTPVHHSDGSHPSTPGRSAAMPATRSQLSAASPQDTHMPRSRGRPCPRMHSGALGRVSPVGCLLRRCARAPVPAGPNCAIGRWGLMDETAEMETASPAERTPLAPITAGGGGADIPPIPTHGPFARTCICMLGSAARALGCVHILATSAVLSTSPRGKCPTREALHTYGRCG